MRYELDPETAIVLGVKKMSEPPKSSLKYITARVTIKDKPRNECLIYYYESAKKVAKKKSIEKTHHFREEVVTQGIIHGADSSALYTIRFVHPRTIEEARKLKPGQYITVLQGRFHPRHKRDGMEFIVKEFTL